MIYIEFDGIILNTQDIMSKEYGRFKRSRPSSTLDEFFEEVDWNEILQKYPANKTNLEIIKKYDSREVAVIVSCRSYYESLEKTIFLRRNGITSNIIICPVDLHKSLLLKPVDDTERNILIDTELDNIIEWTAEGGYGLLYRDISNRSCGIINNLEDVFSLYYELYVLN